MINDEMSGRNAAHLEYADLNDSCVEEGVNVNHSGGSVDETNQEATLDVSDRLARQTAGPYKYYVLFALLLVYVLAFIDRQIIVIMGENIKADLGLSDTQLGALTGFSFALFYVSFGIPVARLADTYNRLTILSVSLAIWSGMTALCGVANSFLQLALARFGVGIGEAGCNPPAYSVIADYFPPGERSTALAVYVSAGSAIGILIGFVVGGIVVDNYGWRAAFVIVGAPGIIFAIILKLTVREPEREGRRLSGDAAPGFAQTLRTLCKIPTFIFISLAVACNAFVIYAILNWFPNFMMRAYGASPSAVGLQLGLLFGLGMGSGGILIGWLCDKLAKRDVRFYVWLPAAAIALTPPLFTAALFAGSMTESLILAILPVMFLNCTAGPVLTIIMGLVETRARALASSLFLLVINVAGLGMSPVGVGLLSDFLEARFGELSIAYALATVVWLNLASALFFLLAARDLKASLSRNG